MLIDFNVIMMVVCRSKLQYKKSRFFIDGGKQKSIVDSDHLKNLS